MVVGSVHTLNVHLESTNRTSNEVLNTVPTLHHIRHTDRKLESLVVQLPRIKIHQNFLTPTYLYTYICMAIPYILNCQI